ncbi:MAG: hypothetical protein J5744_04530 [Oscillospiraceae bacterium]|nr:hypothetical protein [Oscillospiraceae bacterium]
MTTFTDINTGMPLITGIIPEGFGTEAYTEMETFESSRLLKVYARAVKGNCAFYYQTGDTYMYNKSRVPGFFKHVLGEEETIENGNYMVNSFPDIRQQLDSFGSEIAEKPVQAKAYYELSDLLKNKAQKEADRQISISLNEMQLGSRISSMPVTTVVRNYLVDGGFGVYEDEGRVIAVCLERVGLETDLVQGAPTVVENITGEPFAQSKPVFGSIQSQAGWNIPFVTYMISDRKEDLTAFMTFAQTVDVTEQLRSYCDQIHQQDVQYQTQLAQMQTMQTNAMISNMWAQQQQAWAASDRLRDSLSRDLDSFHNNLNQTMAQNDQRIFSGGNYGGETSDDRIQRWRHESMMGVDTFTRTDGTEVEYDNNADRVFESNLDSTQHFGTRHYYDDYIPDGWHELQKKD